LERRDAGRVDVPLFCPIDGRATSISLEIDALIGDARVESNGGWNTSVHLFEPEKIKSDALRADAACSLGDALVAIKSSSIQIAAFPDAVAPRNRDRLTELPDG
jgi:hypothetical protein